MVSIHQWRKDQAIPGDKNSAALEMITRTRGCSTDSKRKSEREKKLNPRFIINSRQFEWSRVGVEVGTQIVMQIVVHRNRMRRSFRWKRWIGSTPLLTKHRSTKLNSILGAPLNYSTSRVNSSTVYLGKAQSVTL
jgi:hypothetical protein